MNAHMLAQFHYPFPLLKDPHAAALQEITDHQLIDGDICGFMNRIPTFAKSTKKPKRRWL